MEKSATLNLRVNRTLKKDAESVPGCPGSDVYRCGYVS